MNRVRQRIDSIVIAFLIALFISSIVLAVSAVVQHGLPALMLFRQIWQEPQRFRSRAWWIAVPFHLLWLPAWYGLLATASHSIEYNPEIHRFTEFNFTWLLTALVVQIMIFWVFLRRYKHKKSRTLVRCTAFLLAGFTTAVLSYWLAGSLYRPLYRWWWEPLLQIMDLDNSTTLRGLNHTDYSAASFGLYLGLLYLYGAVFTVWYCLLDKLILSKSSNTSKPYKIRRPER